MPIASNLLAQTQPDVIVADINPANANINVLTNQLETFVVDYGKQLFTIALTEKSTESNSVLIHNFQIHLTKPVEIAELVAAIASFTGRLE